MEIKKFFLFLILHSSFLTVNCFSQQYGWVPLDPPENVRSIKRIYLEGNKAWLVADSSIFYSPNYPAVQFTRIYSTPANWSNPNLNDIVFRNENGKRYGWAAGGVSFGARSVDDSALVWTDMYLSGDQTYGCISFPNRQIGFGCGTDKYLHKTINGGIDWFDTGVKLGVSSVDGLIFLDTLIGYSAGASPSFKKTTDGGLTWFNVGNITGNMIDIYFLDESHGWAVGASDIIIYRNATWSRVENTPMGTADYSIFFVDQNNGWRVGPWGKIFNSSDGGFTWNEETSGTTKTLHDVFFTSPTNGFAVGFDSTILHYTQLTDVKEQPTYPTAFKLEQNYPNPFNPSTSIQYTIGSRQLVQLKIYDVLGIEIVTLVDEEKTAGTYQVEFNPVSSIRHTASGLYFYQLNSGDYLETKKMIFMK